MLELSLFKSNKKDILVSVSGSWWKFPLWHTQSGGEKAMKKNETKKKTMMAGAGDGGACGQKKVVRHAKDTAMWKKVEGELRKRGLLKGT